MKNKVISVLLLLTVWAPGLSLLYSVLAGGNHSETIMTAGLVFGIFGFLLVTPLAAIRLFRA